MPGRGALCHRGVQADEVGERRGVLRARRPMPERDVLAQRFHVHGQVQRRVPGHLPHQRRVVALHFAAAQATHLHHRRQRRVARHAHGVDIRLRRLAHELAHVVHVAEHHLGVQRRAPAVGAVQRTVAPQGDAAQRAREVRSQEVLRARVASAEPFAVDHRAPHVDAARVVLRQRRDEAVVHRGQDGEVGGAERRLGGLVVSFYYVRDCDSRFRRFQLRGSHWQKASVARARDAPAAYSPDSTMACARPISAAPRTRFVDGAPLAQEVGVAMRHSATGTAARVALWMTGPAAWPAASSTAPPASRRRRGSSRPSSTRASGRVAAQPSRPSSAAGKVASSRPSSALP